MRITARSWRKMPDHERRIHGISVMRNATGRGNRREEEEEKKKKKSRGH